MIELMLTPNTRLTGFYWVSAPTINDMQEEVAFWNDDHELWYFVGLPNGQPDWLVLALQHVEQPERS